MFYWFIIIFKKKKVWSEDTWLQEHALKAVEGALDGDKETATSDDRETKKPKIEIKTNPRVYFDIEIGGQSTGRMIFQLRDDIVPKTVGKYISFFFFFFFLVFH